MKKYMEKIIGILIVLFVVGTTMQSCSEDSKEEENFLQKIDPVEQLDNQHPDDTLLHHE